MYLCAFSFSLDFPDEEDVELASDPRSFKIHSVEKVDQIQINQREYIIEKLKWKESGVLQFSYEWYKPYL